MRFPIYLLLTVISVGLSGSVKAQGIFDLGTITQAISKGNDAQAAQQQAGITTPQKVADISAFNFTPSLELRKSNMSKFIAGMKQLNPEAGAQMEQGLAGIDVMNEMQKTVTPLGLNVNNLADAYVIYFMNAWTGANGITDTPTAAQVAGTKDMVYASFGSSADLAKLSNDDKQNTAEAFILQAVLFDLFAQAAASEPKVKAKVESDIRAGAKTMGIDVDQYAMTPNGLVRKTAPQKK
ncbi:MAG: hypothetical protein HC843_04720 [Sphingomonadales bacterium]|nr:hypothetical protein [Sphingomonadales bacterium]